MVVCGKWGVDGLACACYGLVHRVYVREGMCSQVAYAEVCSNLLAERVNVYAVLPGLP